MISKKSQFLAKKTLIVLLACLAVNKITFSSSDEERREEQIANEVQYRSQFFVKAEAMLTNLENAHIIDPSLATLIASLKTLSLTDPEKTRLNAIVSRYENNDDIKQ